MAGDLRYAWRALMLSPGFCLTAILTLALGIGANTTIFTVVYGVLLKPLPYDAPDRIVRLTEGRPGYSLNVSYPNFIDWRARSHVFNDMAIFNTMGSSSCDTTASPRKCSRRGPAMLDCSTCWA